ncbi:MAG: phosphate acetyltransferase [Bacilli bacterium]|jgi:phosphate acetyltransferase|nr:phosphate acetyltransferase [Bacilli bacterium]
MLLDPMIKEIKGKKLKIVLTEGHDPRVLEAASKLLAEDLVVPVLIGDVKVIEDLAKEKGWDISGAEMIDVATYDKFDEMVSTMVELRKGKQTAEECAKLLKQTNYFGTLMVKMGMANGLVGGATYSTADTVRPALQLVKTKPGSKSVSSGLVLYKDDESEKYVCGDCAIAIDPTSDELAELGCELAKTARMFGIDPRVAFLSYSTKGSGKGDAVTKVVEAVKKVDEMNVDFEYDGELQFDAAFVPEVGQLKSPGSKVAGHANVFVFPEIQSGNIGYKMVQRLGKFNALGPILQGLNAPINDLSRGCSTRDVYEMCIVTAAQSI